MLCEEHTMYVMSDVLDTYLLADTEECLYVQWVDQVEREARGTLVQVMQVLGLWWAG